jgi:hypothetical protein
VIVVAPVVLIVMADIHIVVILGRAIEIASVCTVAVAATTIAAAVAVVVEAIGAIMVAMSARVSVP